MFGKVCNSMQQQSHINKTAQLNHESSENLGLLKITSVEAIQDKEKKSLKADSPVSVVGIKHDKSNMFFNHDENEGRSRGVVNISNMSNSIQ